MIECRNIAKGKGKGELIVSGTKGYVYVPAPWWKTDYFEVRYENPQNNKRHFYQLENEGICYMLVSFLHSIKKIINQFINGNIDELRICDVELKSSCEIPTFTPVETPILHERFEKQVELKSDDVALVATDKTFTYSELNIKANRIANALIKKGVTAKSNVLVMLPRTSDLIASLIGVLKAGCAYMLIDPNLPNDRINANVVFCIILLANLTVMDMLLKI